MPKEYRSNIQSQLPSLYRLCIRPKCPKVQTHQFFQGGGLCALSIGFRSLDPVYLCDAPNVVCRVSYLCSRARTLKTKEPGEGYVQVLLRLLTPRGGRDTQKENRAL